MRIRAAHVLVPLLVLAVSGCNLLKKKKKTFDDDNSSSSPSSSLLEPPAVNRADLTRFSDEVLLHGQADLVRQITFARTAPNEGGSTVGVIDPDTAVLKWSLRGGNTLVTFDRAAFPGKKFAGWVPDASFTKSVAAGSTGTGGVVKPFVGGNPTATPTATVTAIPTVASTTAPTTGTCTLTLRNTSFTPSKSTCSFEEKVRSGSPAPLTFPCAGGPASVRFGSQTFSGTSDANKKINLVNTTIFPFSGCQVRAFQTISGTPPNLNYIYTETIISGNCPNTSTCTARGAISAL